MIVEDKKEIKELSPLVSIIIPVYNSEQCIGATLESVVNQTYTNIEIIIIDDGSTDNGLLIISEYAKKDSRIIYEKKRNEGPSLARKKGLDIARGKYIQFLDSDDTLVVDAIEALLKRAVLTNADIVVAPFFFCMQNGFKKESTKPQFDQISGAEFLKEILFGRSYWSLWSKFQKRSLLQEHAIDMMAELSYGEDVVWTTQIVLLAEKIVSLDKFILNYNERPSSLSHIETFNDKKYGDFKIYSEWVDEFVRKKGLGDELGEALAYFHLKNTFMRIAWRRFRRINCEIKKVLNDIKTYPKLENELQHCERKIINAYNISVWFGHFKLKRYVRQGRI